MGYGNENRQKKAACKKTMLSWISMTALRIDLDAYAFSRARVLVG
jgi:hypothetical protein